VWGGLGIHELFLLSLATTPNKNGYLARAGMIIINKVNLPPEKKTVKPTNLGGVAGGTKFIVNNILFKVGKVFCLYACPFLTKAFGKMLVCS